MKWLVEHEHWVVGALTAGGMLSPRLLPFALLVAACFWPLRRAVNRRWSLRTPVDWPIGLMVLMLPVTLWATSLPEITLPQVGRLCAGVAVFYALVNGCGTSRHKLRQAVLATLAAGLTLALAAPFIVQWNALKLPVIPVSWYSRFVLLASDPANPNVMAGSLLLLLPIALGLVVFAWNAMGNAEKALALACLVSGALMIVLTQSRGAWIGLGAALMVLIALRWRWGWVAPVVALAAGILLALILGWTQLVEISLSSNALGGAVGRLEVWTRAIYMIQDFPFTGIGMGTFTSVVDRLYPFFSYPPGSAEHAHSLFLQVAVDLGLPGLAAWLAIWIGSAWSAWVVYRQSWRMGIPPVAGLRWPAALGAGLLASLVALGVHGLTDAVTWGMVRSAPLVWWVWGLVASLAIVAHEKADTDLE